MEGVGNYEEEEGFFPFRGLFAWFSSSVHPDLIKQWGTSVSLHRLYTPSSWP